LWVCAQANRLLASDRLLKEGEVISFRRGNLVIVFPDSFLIAYFRGKEKEFLRKLNQKIHPFKVKKIFCRFGVSSRHEYGPTLKEK
ncbi:hypothetical protein J7L13_03395, partial [bacterium]|nr:hypothetical protein [bacterium]